MVPHKSGEIRRQTAPKKFEFGTCAERVESTHDLARTRFDSFNIFADKLGGNAVNKAEGVLGTTWGLHEDTFHQRAERYS